MDLSGSWRDHAASFGPYSRTRWRNDPFRLAFLRQVVPGLLFRSAVPAPKGSPTFQFCILRYAHVGRGTEISSILALNFRSSLSSVL